MIVLTCFNINGVLMGFNGDSLVFNGIHKYH